MSLQLFLDNYKMFPNNDRWTVSIIKFYSSILFLIILLPRSAESVPLHE